MILPKTKTFGVFLLAIPSPVPMGNIENGLLRIPFVIKPASVWRTA